MNITIAKIKGTKHKTFFPTYIVRYVKQYITIGTFFNGKVRGKSTQLTLNKEYIHLTKIQTIKVIDALQEGMNIKTYTPKEVNQLLYKYADENALVSTTMSEEIFDDWVSNNVDKKQ